MSYSVSKTAITVYWINLQSNCQYLGEKNTNCLILSINREVFFWWTSWVTPSFFSLNFHGVSRNSFGRNGIPILSFLPLLRPLLPLSPLSTCSSSLPSLSSHPYLLSLSSSHSFLSSSLCIHSSSLASHSYLLSLSSLSSTPPSSPPTPASPLWPWLLSSFSHSIRLQRGGAG